MQLNNEALCASTSANNEADADSQRNQFLLYSKDILSGSSL